MIGATLGNYRITDKLGSGGMGTVYRAVDVMLARDVAIKVLHPHLARDAAFVSRFRREAVALARLAHPNIAVLHGLAEENGLLYMVMEFVRGESLEDALQRSGRLAWPAAAEVLCPVLDALDHAHAMGVVHRDIKPANIMFTPGGMVKVMDFGIARVIDQPRQTMTGRIVGTPLYMAPEQLRGQEVDGRTDLYALGIVLFELVTGRGPFQATHEIGLAMAHLNEVPFPPSGIVHDVPPSIDRIVLRALEKRPGDRFASAAEFRRALREALASAPAVTREVAAPPKVTRLEFVEPVVPAPPDAAPPDAISAVAPTRLADAPAVPPTRLDVPAVPPATAASSRGVEWSRVLTMRASGLMRDWRSYAAAAVVVAVVAVVASIAALTTHASPAARRVTRDPSVVAAKTNTPPAPAPQAPSPGGGAVASLPSASTGIVGLDGKPIELARPTPNEPVPADSAPPRVGTRATPKARKPKPDKNTGAGTKPPAPRDSTPAPAPPRPRETTGGVGDRVDKTDPDPEVASKIAAAVDACVAAVRARDAGAISQLYGSATGQDAHNRDRLLALIREGHLEVEDVQRGSGLVIEASHARTAFDATLVWRTPFGAKRRRAVHFAAELEHGGDGWRMTSCRIAGSLD